jgi:hypothetical protein
LRSVPFLFVLTAAGLMALACRGSSATPAPAPETGPGDIAIETVLQRSVPGQPGGEIREAARDEAAWKALWDRLREGENGVLPAEPPAIDFSRDMVIAAAMPNQPCVSKVTIRGVARSGGELVVDLLEAPPLRQLRLFRLRAAAPRRPSGPVGGSRTLHRRAGPDPVRSLTRR